MFFFFFFLQKLLCDTSLQAEAQRLSGYIAHLTGNSYIVQ